MQSITERYFATLGSLIGGILASDGSGSPLEFHHALGLAAGEVLRRQSGGTVMFVGNGASCAIASHMATDYCKNGGVRAMAFNDPVMLTCMGNDFGYPRVFERPVELFAQPGDLLVAISSSGQSENILRAARMARARQAQVVTLSGFEPGNPLRALGGLNFYVPHSAYGPVEILHHAVCHCILDAIIESRSEGEDQNG